MGTVTQLRQPTASPGPGNGIAAAMVDPARYAIRRDGGEHGRAWYVIVRLVEIGGHEYGVEVPTPGRPRWQSLRNKVEARGLARSMGQVMPGLYRRDYTAPAIEPVKLEEGQI